MKRARSARPTGPRRQRGSAVIEYTVITFLAIVVLITQDNQVARLLEAIKELYEAFSFAISITIPD